MKVMIPIASVVVVVVMPIEIGWWSCRKKNVLPPPAYMKEYLVDMVLLRWRKIELCFYAVESYHPVKKRGITQCCS